MSQAQGPKVDLLRAYSNTTPELEQALEGLSKSPVSPGSDDSVASPSRKTRPRPTRSIVSKMIIDYQEGATSRELAAKYNVPKSSVLVLLRNEGVVRPPSRIRDEQIENAVGLIAQGKSVAIVADELGIAVRSLYHQLKQRGLATRRLEGGPSKR